MSLVEALSGMQPLDEAGAFAEEPNELTCSICLEQIEPVDMAVVKGCEHLHCVCCILRWALYRDACTCPQCKQPFNYLYVHRHLDGTISEYPIEESVCLLKRATWFTDKIRAIDHGVKLSDSAANMLDMAQEDADYAAYYEEYDEDDEIEDYYFSSAAGRARIVIGNRRWGENGSVRAGRMYARPVATSARGGAGSSSGAAAGAASSGATIGKAGARGKGQAGKAKGGAGQPSGTSGAGAHGAAGASSSSSSRVVAAPGGTGAVPSEVPAEEEGSAGGGAASTAPTGVSVVCTSAVVGSTGARAAGDGSGFGTGTGVAGVGMSSTGPAGAAKQGPGAAAAAGAGGGGGSSAAGKQQGRRARRSNRRAAADVGDGGYHDYDHYYDY